jgi:subtilisin family serine protease
MKKYILFVLTVVAVIIFSCEKTEEVSLQNENQEFVNFSEEIIPGQYIVILESSGMKSGFATKELADKAVFGRAESIYNQAEVTLNTTDLIFSAAVEGLVVKMDEDEAKKIASVSGVLGVWPDKMVTLKKPGTDPTDPPEETTPEGISRVGGGTAYAGNGKAWIIDTGIDLDHPDLNVDVENGYLAPGIRSQVGFDDDNGHGSHCAGIVAAIDNEIGVVGVAAGAAVVPVKVLDRRGSGPYSTIIAGVDYVRANASTGDVANMSLGGGVYEPIDLAVQNLAASGVLVALAAGNESDDANNHSPARANGENIYTVSAMDSNDNWASFSNYGNPPIDYCAPGVNILSTYKSGGYATMSGTSMAAPHVCGLLLVTGGNINSDGAVNGDPDGDPDPIAHN